METKNEQQAKNPSIRVNIVEGVVLVRIWTKEKGIRTYAFGLLEFMKIIEREWSLIQEKLEEAVKPNK